MLRVIIFDDVVAARGEEFRIPGLEVHVVAHADGAVDRCTGDDAPDVVFMDFALGSGRADGAAATKALRDAGYRGRVIAISSDPAANAAMRSAGADDALSSKALLRSYLVHLGDKHLAGGDVPSGG
jgi:CheY-like chemotaxis protein